jgi:cysteinyl-tRNA synthetase
MSKSLGNFTTIRALLESGVSPMTLRLFVLQAHYRKPLDFTTEALEAAATGWKGLNAALGLGERHGQSLEWTATPALAPVALVGTSNHPSETLEPLQQRFIEAMDDDLNSSGALAVLFDLAKPLRALANRVERGDEAKRSIQAAHLEARWKLLRDLALVLGLRYEGRTKSSLDGTAITAAIDARRAAKADKNFSEADRIREELAAQGVELIDKPGGITEFVLF